MSKLPLIIKREFLSRVRNRTFIVMTFLSPLIVVVMITLIAWLATLNEDAVKKIAIVDETGMFVQDFEDTEGVAYADYTAMTLPVAKEAVVAEELYALLYIPKTASTTELTTAVRLFAEESPSYGVLRQLEDRMNERLTAQNYQAIGLDATQIKAAQQEIAIRIEDFAGEQTSKMANYIKMGFGALAGYLLMMFIVIYGNMVMRSVIEEKTNRIIEIIISSVKPMQLMLGKIVGTSFAGILQFLIWVLLGTVLLIVGTLVFGTTPEPTVIDPAMAMSEATPNIKNEIIAFIAEVNKLPLGTLVTAFFIYFVGGYFLYSSIYAAIGAAVDNETDSQQFMLPILFPLILGVYIGFFVVIENPHGTVATLFSMLPLTSPIVMLMRIPFGVPIWQVVVSILILIGSIIFMVWLASKIYRIGILMYGKKPTYKELFKWLKY